MTEAIIRAVVYLVIMGCIGGFVIYCFELFDQNRKDKKRREAEQLAEIEKRRLYEARRAEQKIGWRKGERPSERARR